MKLKIGLFKTKQLTRRKEVYTAYYKDLREYIKFLEEKGKQVNKKEFDINKEVECLMVS